jgi:hypothetical protein
LFDFTVAPAIAPAQPSVPPDKPKWRRQWARVAAIAAATVGLVVGAIALWPDPSDGGEAQGDDTASVVNPFPASRPEPTCAGDPVPAPAWTGSRTTDDDVAVVRRYFDLMAGARSDLDNTVLYDEMKQLFPDTPIQSESQLTRLYSNIQASGVRRIATGASGSTIVGQLVWYNRVDDVLCRTGFACYSAVVDDGRVVALRRGTPPKGAFAGPPHLDNRWYAPADVARSGVTAEQLLVDLCRRAIYT